MVRVFWRKFLLYSAALSAPPICVVIFSRFDALSAVLLGGWAGIVAAIACTMWIVRDAKAKGWKAALMYVGLGMALCALSLASTFISYFLGPGASTPN